MSKMRVLIPLYAFYPSQLGGPCNTLYWLGKEFVNNGVEVVAIASDNGVSSDLFPADKWNDLDGIKIRYCKTKNAKRSLKIIYHSLANVSKSDLLIFSSLCYIPYLFIGLLGIILGKKIIWSPRGELFDGALGGSRFKKVYFKFLRILFKRNTTFQVTSEEEKELVLKYFGSNASCVLIPNFMELPQKLDVETENYLLYVGRINPIKALENLIEALSLSSEFMNSDFKLLLAGKNDGEYYNGLLDLVSEYKLVDRVKFLGLVEGREKEMLFAKAKATFLVSHSENFGNVVIESLAQGTPAICSHGTPWQSLDEKNCGYWIDNSSVSIAETIDKLLQLPKTEYNNMRCNAYKYCQSEFDIKTNINRWLELLNN